MDIVISKRYEAPLAQAERDVVQRFLFGAIDGATERDGKAWRGFWRGVAEAPAGEFFTITIRRQRNSRFHRLIMKVLTEVFNGQEVFQDFKLFRAWISIGAGHVDYVPDGDGGVTAVPKSLSFEECSEDEAREFFDSATKFLRTTRAQTSLWPHMSPQLAEQGMMRILRQFDRDPS